jgi:hypothetical protein
MALPESIALNFWPGIWWLMGCFLVNVHPPSMHSVHTRGRGGGNLHCTWSNEVHLNHHRLWEELGSNTCAKALVCWNIGHLQNIIVYKFIFLIMNVAILFWVSPSWVTAILSNIPNVTPSRDSRHRARLVFNGQASPCTVETNKQTQSHGVEVIIRNTMSQTWSVVRYVLIQSLIL